MQLRDHPVLAWYLNQLCFEEYRLDGGPRLIGESTGEEPLTGGNEPREWSRSYYQQNGVRFAQGVLALWALADAAEGDGGFVLVPASHKSYAEWAPEEGSVEASAFLHELRARVGLPPLARS